MTIGYEDVGYLDLGYGDPGYFGVATAPTPPPDFGGTFLPLAVLIRRRLAAVSAAFPGLVTSDDWDFLSGLIHVCRVEYDANAAGGTAGRGGASQPDWQPVVGLQDVACRIVWRSSSSSEAPGKPGSILVGKVLFGQSIVAGRTHRLVYADPDSDATSYAYLVGPVRNAHFQNHHWVADVQDQTLA